MAPAPAICSAIRPSTSVIVREPAHVALVRHHHHRATRFRQHGEELQHRRSSLGIEIARGLVGQQQPWVVGKGR
jgi:predicted metallo-beta-lactamase superfamily hydrolase